MLNKVQIPEMIPEKCYSTEEVGISRITHDEHLKLWQGYAKKTNELRELISHLEKDPSKANQIYSSIRALKVDYTFAYQGLINHNIYFDTIGGKGGKPTGKVADLINKSFGSYENWVNDWKCTGMGGRGWAFLSYDHQTQTLFNYIGDAQNSFPIWNHTCILAMDVYEHAYYYDFQTARMKYIESYLQVIDWDAVNKRIENR